MPSWWTNQTVLVTGGTGFLGSAVVRALLSRCPAVVHAPSSTEADLRDRAAAAGLLAETSPTLVIHLAARVGGIGANRERPADLYLDNLLMGTNVIEEARLAAVEKTVVVGTVCSYPRTPPVPFKEEYLWQGFPEETNAPYGIAKLAQLLQLQSNHAQHGQRFAYLIPTNLYGPGDKFHPAVSHVVPALIRRIHLAMVDGEDTIEVWGTGSATREFLYVDDAAEGVLLAAEHYDGTEPMNLGTNHEIAISDLLHHLVDLMDFKGQVVWDKSKPDGQPRRRVDASRAHSEIGFTPTTDLHVGLQETINWYLEDPERAELRST